MNNWRRHLKNHEHRCEHLYACVPFSPPVAALQEVPSCPSPRRATFNWPTVLYVGVSIAPRRDVDRHLLCLRCLVVHSAVKIRDFARKWTSVGLVSGLTCEVCVNLECVVPRWVVDGPQIGAGRCRVQI